MSSTATMTSRSASLASASRAPRSFSSQSLCLLPHYFNLMYLYFSHISCSLLIQSLSSPLYITASLLVSHHRHRSETQRDLNMRNPDWVVHYSEREKAFFRHFLILSFPDLSLRILFELLFDGPCVMVLLPDQFLSLLSSFFT